VNLSSARGLGTLQQGRGELRDAGFCAVYLGSQREGEDSTVLCRCWYKTLGLLTALVYLVYLIKD
jgi:alpha/beta superfamily hydrolase